MPFTEHILLVRPSRFVFNTETADSNAFQNKPSGPDEEVSSVAAKEFDLFASTLKSKGVNVIVIEDTEVPVKPDAVFPNNWVSFHNDGTVVLYPMFAENRRMERRPDILEKIQEKFIISNILDYSFHEEKDIFLEGTGSIVFDHYNKIAYACISPRTDKDLFIQVVKKLGYKPVHFFARDREGKEIYHTNVMMCNAVDFTVICMESITDPEENKMVRESLESTGHKIIDISYSQMINFAGNMLAIKNRDEERFLVMSRSAHDSLTKEQKEIISKYCEMLPMDIKLIETIGGGSARCMMAEVFLPERDSR